MWLRIFVGGNEITNQENNERRITVRSKKPTLRFLVRKSLMFIL